MVNNEGIGAEMMCVMVECKELEESYGTCFTNEDEEQVSTREVHDTWRGVGRNQH